MKVYIPTTILNLSEILATDSISPSSFYNNRRFGSSHWYNVPEESAENVILLYQKPFHFYRPKSELEDRPMLISMEVDGSLPVWQDGILYSDHTLFFDWTTEFLFFTQEDIQIAISLARIWESTKMLGLYERKRMKPIEEELMPLGIKVVERVISIDKKQLEIDYKINKLKGTIYGYYVGAVLSTTPFELGILKGKKSIYDILSSTISQCSPLKKEALKLSEILRNAAKECISEQISLMREQQRPLLVRNHEIQINNLKVNAVRNNNIKDGLEHEILLTWLNSTLCSIEWGGCVNAVNADLADAVTDAAKALFKNDWENSYTRRFLNGLRHHIAGEPFQEEWSNGMLPSLMAFLLKGDDWEDMLSFMQDKGMNDYRLAFAFYGTFKGFASFPRSLSNLLLNREKTYVAEFYNDVYRQLFDKDIPMLSKQALQKEIEAWKSEIVQFVKESGVITLKNKKQMWDSLNDAFAKNGGNTDYNIFLHSLSKYKGWGRNSNAWKKMRDRFAPDYEKCKGEVNKSQKSKKSKSLNLQMSLFENNEN